MEMPQDAHIQPALGSEISRSLRTMADNCLEEGQYEAAITILDQLRSERVDPHSSHVRQLVCIALYPSFADPNSKNRRAWHEPDIHASPSKVARQQRSPLYPSPTDACAAQQLLISMCSTCRLDSIFRSLPGFHQSSEFETVEDDSDSLIAQEALSIKHMKTCWELLNNGFRDKARLKGKNDRGRSAKPSSYRTEQQGTIVVGENAYPLLDWLATLFEIDEAFAQRDGQPRYSSFLLQQIPPARGESGVRWETDVPLEIVFHCLRQDGVHRRKLGARLLTSIVNLTSTTLLDHTMLVGSTLSRLIMLSPHQINDFWVNMSTAAIMLHFKISLCLKYLMNSDITPSSAAARRPKPQVRAQPRNSRQFRATDRGAHELPTDSPAAIARKLAVPPFTEILRLIERNPAKFEDAADEQIYFKMKYELFASYITFQGGLPSNEMDTEWKTFSEQTVCAKSIENAFARPAGKMYADLLIYMLSN